ncbi:SIR2 family protein [Novosphingobium jiangmenense]|uniref:SIR2 family protein n=1 Tax=Novosphingobium jiangmenense TaxID=2791981 RepID=A0ABS0HJV2_9SPHN|nr:SIR2 family protein [Novosphingobium jiangmenense]MBF9152537.1 SIR2 family protein [Novosphingobium jiangmenense]
MLRTRTTLIIGAGASAELQFPSNAELLARIIQGYDFKRTASDTSTRDGQLLLRNIYKLAERLNKKVGDVAAAAERLRNACRLGRSIDTVLEQYDHDPLVLACGKLAITFFMGQAESRSNLKDVPRVEGELPLQGKIAEYWIYQLGQLITSGVPRSKIGQTLEQLTIINFNYDRSLEHFLPYALVMAYGIELKEAQQVIAEKLDIVHPHGSIGRLPWQKGEAPQAEWGVEQPWNIHAIAAQLKSLNERSSDRNALRDIRLSVASAKRLVFLGFGFQPQNVDLLFENTLSHNPEVLISTYGMSSGNAATVAQMIRRLAGLESPEQLMISPNKAWEVLRDYSLLLES